MDFEELLIVDDDDMRAFCCCKAAEKQENIRNNEHANDIKNIRIRTSHFTI